MSEILHPDRHLSLEGSLNLRDLGGYRTEDGRQTRWKRFLRADSLHELPPASQDALIEYGVRTVIDLRFTRETRGWPNVFAESPRVAFHHQNMIGDTLPEGYPTEGEGPEMVKAIYRAIIDGCFAQVCQTLTTLADPEALTGLYHCASGKDRTGLISALLLGLAGVPRETIAADYALSARYLAKDRIAAQGPDSGMVTWEDYQRQVCPPEVMLATLQHLEERYGGIEAYVRAVGMAPEKIAALRANFVE
jgi:protein-tyrosine phosphatase